MGDTITEQRLLLSHLQGDALNVALLKPMPRRASRKELTDALLAHYGSPRRLANYRQEFDKTVRKPGEDPSNFAIALETLAVKAFGDMGQAARLRLIRDRFIAGHGSCELRRYLDCVPPDTPLRDIVDRCRVWESHADPEVRRVSKPMPEPTYPAYVVNEPEYETEPVRVVTVNKPNSSVDQMEELVKRLLPQFPLRLKVPETSPMDKVVREAQTGPSGTGQISRIENDALNVVRGTAAVTTTAPVSTGTTRQARNEVFFMWENGSWRKPLPNLGRDLPIYITGLEG